MRSLLYALLLLVLPVSSPAADLLVAVGGSGNIHPTISSAIAAAVNGDRILIMPGTYTENLTVNKSLEFNCNTNGQRFRVNGNVVLSATGSGVKITFNGMVLQGSVTEQNGSTMGTGSVFTMTGCTSGNVAVSVGQAVVQLYRDSINGEAFIGRGTVAGCVISGGPAMAGVRVFPSSPFTATSRIVGNVIGSAMTNSSFWPIVVNSDFPFVIENNLLLLNMSSSGSYPIYVSNRPVPTTTLCTIRNNTILHPLLDFINMIEMEETDPVFQVDIRNNYFVGPLQNPPIDVNGNPNATQAYNIQTADLANANAATGAPTPGSPAINAGDPEVVYTDLDLTRNDAGCYGGSLSRDNFDDALPATAIVGMLNAPRRTQAALTISITADGFDR